MLTSTGQSLAKKRPFHVEGQTLFENPAKSLSSVMVPEGAPKVHFILLTSTRNVNRVRLARVVGVRAGQVFLVKILLTNGRMQRT